MFRRYRIVDASSQVLAANKAARWANHPAAEAAEAMQRKAKGSEERRRIRLAEGPTRVPNGHTLVTPPRDQRTGTADNPAKRRGK